MDWAPAPSGTPESVDLLELFIVACAVLAVLGAIALTMAGRRPTPPRPDSGADSEAPGDDAGR